MMQLDYNFTHTYTSLQLYIHTCIYMLVNTHISAFGFITFLNNFCIYIYR